MKFVIVAITILICTISTLAGETEIQRRPFDTIDFSEEFWKSISEDRKFKGAVSDLISYNSIRRVIIIRVNISIPGGTMLENSIQKLLKGNKQFHTGSIPAWNSVYSYPWITALLETSDGDLSLLNIYREFSVLEYKGRCGIILSKF